MVCLLLFMNIFCYAGDSYSNDNTETVIQMNETAAQTSDYTFIINAVLIIIAAVIFIFIRISKKDI